MLASHGQLDEPDEFDEPVVSSASELSEEVGKLVREMVGKAAKKGFPKEHLDELLRISLRFDLWKEELGNNPPPLLKYRL
ncbi:hypothetical protein P3T76_004663 [Phytophthora citrophthora]|uniref:Uncharacterized protein n=1 Tax=Phytophthora citrophthora TaxID=4793 RepID=A0AAD9LQ21_9STRA|nr:hypothetical protein P3T76_004663 [Phytophthora citrophthora]